LQEFKRIHKLRADLQPQVYATTCKKVQTRSVGQNKECSPATCLPGGAHGTGETYDEEDVIAPLSWAATGNRLAANFAC